MAFGAVVDVVSMSNLQALLDIPLPEGPFSRSQVCNATRADAVPGRGGRLRCESRSAPARPWKYSSSAGLVPDT